ncbi:hypothetical protein [Imhoffiella purpurea]|uniref:Uncharacterized protein n=1 Tax=Imhoffiella purpurea TaxID=1249627 RepID=W9VBR5_9GAMM|nr:hypothetical protein [Imhoffiella purpurea]EXJ14411.1 hypothetical protein D779_2552 [Imhoffiella purpurea]
MTPLEKVEALYEELVVSYGDGRQREIRAASKLLLIALFELKEHDNRGWQDLVEDHVRMLRDEPERYRRLIDANRGRTKGLGLEDADLQDFVA